MKELQREIHKMAVDKGWYPNGTRNIPEALALVHSEVSEALEEFRNGHDPKEIYFKEDGKPEGFGIELADAVIRILDLAGHFGLDMEKLVELKVRYNSTREFRHGGKKA